jgi:Bacterial inner membrane protein
MFEGLGWVATALFAVSYFCKTPRSMRRVQALAAFLWVGYGIWMNALPIIVANLVVASLALYSDWKQPRSSITDERQSQPETTNAQLSSVP